MTRLAGWLAGWLATLLVFSGVGALAFTPVDDPDFWWLLRAGRHMIETRTFLTTDPFSATAAGAEWLNHAWGFELLLYGVFTLGGTTGLIVMQALFAVLTFGVLYRVLRREGLGQPWALALVGLGALATRGFWTPRPQLVTYLFLVVFWAILRGLRDGRRTAVWWLAPLAFVWVNFHGGFLIGPALVSLCLAGAVGEWVFARAGAAPEVSARLRTLALVLPLTVLASLVNPFHYRALLFPVHVVQDALSQAYITEWGSVPFQHPQAMLLEALLGLTLLALLAAPRAVPLGDLVVLVVFVHLGLQAIRNTPPLVIVLLPILGRALSGCEAVYIAAAGPGWRRSARLAAGAAILAASCLLAGTWQPAQALAALRPRLGEGDSFPAGAVEFLQRHRQPATLFNEYVWGGYLIWHLYPDYRVSIDGRMAVYGSERFREHVIVANLHPGWRESLDRFRADVVLVRPGSPLVSVLRVSPGWTVVYEDRVGVVLRRADVAR